VTDGAGSVVQRIDYEPFGQELAALVGNRTETIGYAPSNASGYLPLRFTAKERELKSDGALMDLYYFGARYFSGSQGRFTSSDPENASASLFNPQAWNAYSYALNNPYRYVDDDGRMPLLAITAGVGALVGGTVSGGVEAFSQYTRKGHIDSWGKVGTAFLGGAVAGGVAGLTLGVGTTAGVAVTTAEVVVANGASSVLGGIVQRGANAALDLDPAADGETELLNVGLDAATGALGGYVGGRLAERYYPLPNVRREIQLLQHASRRSQRAARISTFREQVSRQAFFNAFSSGTAGGLRSEGVKFVWNWIADPPPVKAAQKKKDYAADVTITYSFPE
jgi:RHS repeat-associated protein